MLYSPPKIENVSVSDLPAYTGGYLHCRVLYVDPNTTAKYEQVIKEEDAAFLRNLFYKHKQGLKIKSASLADKVRSLENIGLVSTRSKRFYLTPLATVAEYTMIPRVLFIEDS